MPELSDIIGSYREVIDVHLPPYNAKGDCMRGRDGVTDGTNRFAVADYPFSAADVGKTIWIDIAGQRTIASVPGSGDPNACIVSGAALSAGTSRGYVFGTDDTAAIQLALDAARISARGMFVGANTQGLKKDIKGRSVKLRSGCSYLVSNSQASFNAGKTACLIVHRRTALVGDCTYSQSDICRAPGSYGDVVANADARLALANNSTAGAYVDYLTLANFTIYGSRGLDSSGVGKSNLLIYPSYNGYLDTDPKNQVFNVNSIGAPEHNFYFGGRGELLMSLLRGEDAASYGCLFDGLVDSSLSDSSFGGNKKTGVRVKRSANCRIDNVKSWYSGAAGGTDVKDCANFVFEADQANNGKVICTLLDAQESRGSSFVLENSGYNVFRACRSQDAGQQNGLNSGTLPTIRAGVHMTGAGSIENSFDIRVEPGVRAFNTPNFTGSHALYVDDNAAGNYGAIEAQVNMVYTGRSGVDDGAKLGGPGVANGKNTRLRVDGVALT